MTESDLSVHPDISSTPDLAAVVSTLTASFSLDPILTWAIPMDIPGRTGYLDAFFTLVTQDILDHGGLVASAPNYDAVLVWSQPGVTASDSTAVPEADVCAFLDTLQDSTGPTGSRVRVLMELLDAHHPTGLPPHCHVMFAAVREHARGSGIRATVTGALREIRTAASLGVYAEASSQRSLQLWQRLGLVRVGAEIALPHGGPSLFPIFAGPSV